MKKLSIVLLVLVMGLGLAGEAGAQKKAKDASAQSVDDVCSIRDFGKFIEKYSALSRNEQARCIKYPVSALVDGTINKFSKFSNQSKFDAYWDNPNRGGTRVPKYVLSAKDFTDPKVVSKPFFSPGGPKKGKLGYGYKSEVGGVGLSFWQGCDACVPWYSVTFKYFNDLGKWVMTEVWLNEEGL